MVDISKQLRRAASKKEKAATTKVKAAAHARAKALPISVALPDGKQELGGADTAPRKPGPRVVAEQLALERLRQAGWLRGDTDEGKLVTSIRACLERQDPKYRMLDRIALDGGAPLHHASTGVDGAGSAVVIVVEDVRADRVVRCIIGIGYHANAKRGQYGYVMTAWDKSYPRLKQFNYDC